MSGKKAGTKGTPQAKAQGQKETAKKRAEGKDLGGRPPFQIDYKQLEAMCGVFLPGEDCAVILGCSYQTLNLRLQEDYTEALAAYEADPSPENEALLAKRANGFKEYYARFSAHGRALIRQKQLETAKEGNVSMLKHLGNNYCGQSHRVDHTTAGEKLPGAKPMPDDLDMTQLSPEEFTELGNLLQKATKSTKPDGDEQVH